MPERGHLVAMRRAQKVVVSLVEKSQSKKVQETNRTSKRDSPAHFYQDYIKICLSNFQVTQVLDFYKTVLAITL